MKLIQYTHHALLSLIKVHVVILFYCNLINTQTIKLPVIRHRQKGSRGEGGERVRAPRHKRTEYNEELLLQKKRL